MKKLIEVLLLFSAYSNSHASLLEEVVVSGTRVATTLEDLPSNVSLLNAEQLQLTSAVHIQQALNQVPGITTQRGNGQESLPGIRSAVLTGAGACGSVLILEEAIPVRGPALCNNELFDTHFEQAQKIDVTRGPSTAFFGSNGLTGSVNVSLPVTGADRVSLEVGENSYVRAKASLGYGSDQSTGRFYLTVTDDGGYRDESGYNQQKVSWRHQQGIGEWQLNAGLTATRLDQETAGFIVGLDSYLDRNLARQNLDPEAFRETEALRAWARLSRQLNDKQTLQITPYLRSTDMDFRLHFLPGDPLEQNQQVGVGWQSSLTTQASDSFKWVVGVDGDFSRGELRQTQENPTQGSAFLQETIPVGTHYDYQVDTAQLALFAHINWQINEKWDLVAGVRVETLRYDYDNRALDGRTRDDGSECGFGGCRYARPADREDDFTNVSPKAELRYRLNEALKFYVSAAQSFRAPQATELYRLQRAQQVADLDNVEATSFEAGVFYANETLELNASVYQISQRNVIIRDSDFFNVDGTELDSLGLELSFRQKLSEQWSWRLVGSIAQHEYASDQFSGGSNINGNEVDTAPNTSGSAFLNWRPTARFNAELQLQHLGEYFLEPENLREYPGHTLLNLRGSYQIDDHWQASLRVTNLADRDYAERADFTSFTNERYFPGEPRSVFGSIEYRFR